MAAAAAAPPDTLADLAYQGNVAVLTARLAQPGANPDDEQQFFSGAAPLFCAARYGHIGCVDVLLKSGAAVGLPHPECGTALHGAACSGHAEIVRLLLLNQAPPNALDMNGDTALTLAAFSGHVAVVRALIDGDAETALRHPEYGTAAEIAAEEGHVEVLALLERCSAGARACGRATAQR